MGRNCVTIGDDRDSVDLATQRARARKRHPHPSAKRCRAMIEAAEGFRMDVSLVHPNWFAEAPDAQSPQLEAQER